MTTLAWRKSTYSAESGNCVEVAWRKSSFSGSGEACIEVAPTHEAFLVRDSKNPTGPTLTLPTPHWRHLLSAVAR